jgi:cobalt-zinc-cadmium efflux system outer membrane protein
VKYAKARAAAIEGQRADSELQFYHRMKALHAKATDLQNSVNSYRSALAQYSNNEFLVKALAKGEISLGEYFVELSFYYGSVDKLLDMEQALQSARSELMRYQ